MKNRGIAFLSLCITLIAISGVAQQPPPLREPDLNRPKLFENLPDSIPIEFNLLADLVMRPAGYRVNGNLAKDGSFPFEGEIISSVTKFDERIQTVVIRAANYANAHFTLSRVRFDDGTIQYTGRILSFRHGDVLELGKKSDGYFLLKKGFYQVVND